MICSLFKLAYPFSFMVFCVSSTFAMIVLIEWREQIRAQMKVHPSQADVEQMSRTFPVIAVT